MRKCLDEGIIQAYLDGELAPGAAREAAAHLSACAACAAQLADAEQCIAFVAASFGPDADLPVPTETLRARVNAAVARLEAAPEAGAGRARGWNLGALLAPFTGLFTFTPQRAAAFAGVLAVVALGVVLFAVRERTAPVNPAREEVAADVPPSPVPTPAPQKRNEVATVTPAPVVNTPRPRSLKASVPRRAVNPVRPPASSEVAAAEPEPVVPGEKNYREAIASLEQVVKAGGDTVLAPKARIEYERSVAVLDRAIEETRRAALRNPKDKDAVGFLMAAYQSKVELLSTVADQTQFASIGR